MSRKRFISTIAIFLTICVGIGIYGFVRSNQHPQDYKLMNEVKWVLPPGNYNIENNDELYFVTKGGNTSLLTIEDGKPKWRAEGDIQYGGNDTVIYRESGRFGYMDLDGKVLIKAKFDVAYEFNGDFAEVRETRDTGPAIINRQGEVLYDFEEGSYVSWMKDNLLAVYAKDGQLAKVLDCRTGNELAKTAAKPGLRYLGEGIYAWIDEVKKEDYIYTIVDETGQPLFGEQRFLYIGEFDHGIALVSKEKGERGYMTSDGDMIFLLDDGWRASDFQEGRGFVDTGNKLLIIDAKGKRILERDKGEIADVRFLEFSEGLAAAYADNGKGQWRAGYLNVKAQWVVPPIFSQAGPVHGGCAVVYYGYRSGIIKEKSSGMMSRDK